MHRGVNCLFTQQSNSLQTPARWNAGALPAVAAAGSSRARTTCAAGRSRRTSVGSSAPAPPAVAQPLHNSTSPGLPSSSTPAAPAAAAAGDAVAALSGSLRQLQHSASSLAAEPTVDGLLTAFQQLGLIQQQLQQECRQCKVALFKLQSPRRSSSRARTRKAAPPAAADAAAAASEPDTAAAAVVAEVQAQLVALNQLRASADDAQDFLLGLVQQLLQDKPPAACSQLLTSAAFRQLNVECLNRLAVNAFVDKQAGATPQDMAGLMAALALVRCCSSSRSNQVCGFERQQLSSLFSGIMSHLLAHVSNALQQQQQGAGTAEGRRRRQAAEVSPAEASAAVDQEAYRQQVAAALAAHVSARVPFNSSLAPHVLHILQDQAPKWLHSIADVESAPSITQLAALLSHPSRYDYPYLAAAFNRLAVLAEQQQQQQQDEDPAGPAAASEQQRQAQRLAKVLVGRLRQLQADATAAELPLVLAAADKLGMHDARLFATAAASATAAENLAAASDACVASIMCSVAGFSSSPNGQQQTDFPRKQQQAVLRKCLARLAALAEQQQALQRQQLQPRSLAAAAAAAVAGTDAPPGGVTSRQLLQPANLVLGLWAAATAGVTGSKQLQLSVVFESYLAEQSVLQQLLGSSSSSGGRESGRAPGSQKQQQQQQQPSPAEVVSTCGSILWAAAQLGYAGSLRGLRPFAAAFLDAVHATPAGAASSLTVAQSLATLLSRQQQQQQQQGADAGEELLFWQSSFLQCSEAAVQGLRQQGQGPEQDAAAAAQLLAAFEEAGLSPPEDQMRDLQLLTGEQAPQPAPQPTWQPDLAAVHSVTQLVQQLQSPAAATALADPSTAAAVLSCLMQLQQQGQQVAAPAAEDNKTLIKQCCSLIAQHLTPTLQSQLAAAGKGRAAAASAAAASAAAAVMLAASQLNYKDPALAAACLSTLHTHMEAATAADTAAAVAALSAAGRAVVGIYGSEGSTLQQVLAGCTDKLVTHHLQPLLTQRAHQAAAAAADPLPAESPAAAPATGTEAAAAAAAAGGFEQSPVVIAQQLLQLHACVGLQPSAEQTFLLLSAVADELALAQLRPNAAAAALVASLAAAAELSQMPYWQGISSGSSSSSDAAEVAGGVGRQQRRRGKDVSDSSSSGDSTKQQQQIQFPWAWQSQQQLLLQELWQQLLLDCLLPRLTSATPKQLAAALQAVVVFAGRSSQQQQQHPATSPTTLDIGLAKDFARCVLDTIAPQHLAGAAAAAGAVSTNGFLSGWRPGDWKGEHLAAVAAAAAQLDVPRATFFSAVEAQLLLQHQQQQQQPHSTKQQRGSLVSNVQLQHLISICCTAAALDCRVEQLLFHAVAQALQQLRQQQQQQLRQQQQQQQQQGTAQQGVSRSGQAGGKQQQKRAAAVEPELLLLLAWAVAVMDVSQLAEQAHQLAAAAVAQLKKQLTAAIGSNGSTAAGQGARGSAGALPPVLAARLLQVEIWLADVQSSRASTGSSANGGDAGFSQLLVGAELQAATAACLSMQQSSSPYIPSIAAAVGHLLHQQQQPSEPLVQVQQHGCLVADVWAVIGGVPVAVLVLDDAEEGPAAVGQAGDTAAAAAESLAAGWAPPHRTTTQKLGHSSSTRQPQRQAGSRVMAAGAVADGSNSCGQLLLSALSQQRLGDVMWRARALASRGVWCEVVSSRDWVLLEGHRDAQVEVLRERLWPLMLQEGPADAAAGVRAAQPQAV